MLDFSSWKHLIIMFNLPLNTGANIHTKVLTSYLYCLWCILFKADIVSSEGCLKRKIIIHLKNRNVKCRRSAVHAIREYTDLM